MSPRPRPDLHELEEAASEYAAAQAQRNAARDRLREAVRASYQQGATEMDLASRAGVTRMTVRSWLGKGSSGRT